jgi:hypothetical protein
MRGPTCHKFLQQFLAFYDEKADPVLLIGVLPNGEDNIALGNDASDGLHGAVHYRFITISEIDQAAHKVCIVFSHNDLPPYKVIELGHRAIKRVRNGALEAPSSATSCAQHVVVGSGSGASAPLPIGLDFLSGRPALRSTGASYFSTCLLSFASFLVGAMSVSIGAGASPTNTFLLLGD